MSAEQSGIVERLRIVRRLLPSEVRHRSTNGELEVDLEAVRALIPAKGPEVPRELAEGALRALLNAAAEPEPAALRRSDAEKVLFPTFLAIQNRELTDALQPELQRLRLQRDLLGWQRGHELLASLAKDGDVPADVVADQPGTDQRDESGDAAANGLLGLLLTGNPPDLSVGRPSRASVTMAASMWAARRESVLAPARSRSDAWVLQTVVLLGAPMPVNLAEGLYRDEETWREAAMVDFANARQRPFTADELGLAGAALVNSRFRYVRPMVFLRHQDTLVLEPISSDSSIQAAKALVSQQVVEPILRVVSDIDEETHRSPKLPPRKKTFYRLREYVEQVLGVFGYALIEQGGETVQFDPGLHDAHDACQVGADVVVARPGLRSIQDDLVIVKAQVATATTALEEQAE